MTLFFFYKHLTNLELLKKIHAKFEVIEGYILVQSYDSENDILVIGDNTGAILHGKLVKFDSTVEHVVNQINTIEECKLKNDKYTLDTVWVNAEYGGVYKAYIIY
jgi:hypothetical protein